MSLSEEIIVACPNCNNKQKMTYWKSINISVNPELRDELLYNRINIFNCRKCGYTLPYGGPLLYNDPEMKLAVYFYPLGLLQPDTASNVENVYSLFGVDGQLKEQDYPESIKIIAKKAGLDSSYLTKPHVVLDMDELRRYITFRYILHNVYYKN